VNEQEFLDQYMKPRTGIYAKARAFGASKAEKDTVKEYLDSTGSFDPDLFHPSMIQEYIPIRNKAFTSKYGEGFPEMYDKYKNLGTGAFGAVFQNPDDPSKVFKVQRQPSYYEQGRGDTEFETQKTAAQMGVAPNIYSVTNFPTKKLTPEEELDLYDKRNEGITPRIQKMEMDKVNTIDAQGGHEKMILDHLGITRNQYINMQADRDTEGLQPTRNEKRKLSLALAKQQLNLADKGIVHTDLGNYPVGSREDHIAYDPATNKMQFIDYGFTDHYDHADNLHEHTKNLNLKEEELKDYTPGANAEHFLDHKVNNIVDAMRSVGDSEQADRFREIYDSTVDNDLIAADNFVNEYRDVVKDMSFDDADLKLRKGKKTGNLYGEIRNPSVSEFLTDFME
tara:strand:- start:52 stop:1236 length:1185 start_codon:yes stop_codon:yes gene_type:complete